MLGKLFLTLFVIVVAVLVVRQRWRQATADPSQRTAGALAASLVPAAAVRMVAWAVLGLMITGSGLWLYQDWAHQHAVIEVQVVNPSSGVVQSYRARRGDIDGRSFRTLDGHTVRIAEMERLILID